MVVKGEGKDGEKTPILGISIKLSETPGRVESAPARFGEHREEVLRERGFEAEEITDLRERGALSLASA